MYNSEQGPTVYDAPAGGGEINEIIRGANYGWPKYHHQMTDPGFQVPLLEYTPAIAPSGIAFYIGGKISAWKNDLFVACLRGQQLLRVHISANGRVVETSPDGTLLVISEAGKLIQLR